MFVETAGSVWWQWTAPFTGIGQVGTAGSTFDTFLAVSPTVTGTPTRLAEPIPSSFAARTLSESKSTPSPCETYQISVYSLGEIGTGTGVRGDIVLSIAEAPLMPHDHFTDAIDFVGPSMTGTNINATLELGEVVPDAIDAEEHGTSVWWTWVADRDGSVSFDTFGSGFGTVLTVWTGEGVDALVEVASNDDCSWSPSSADNASEVFFNATTGGSSATGGPRFAQTSRPLWKVASKLYASASNGLR